jgi:hypothetical protein
VRRNFGASCAFERLLRRKLWSIQQANDRADNDDGNNRADDRCGRQFHGLGMPNVRVQRTPKAVRWNTGLGVIAEGNDASQ